MRSQTLVGVRPSETTEGAGSRSARRLGSAPAPNTQFIGRAGTMRAAVSSLRRPGRVGAVIVGEAGIGKTAVLQAVQRSLSETHLIRVRGLQSSTSSPYRALSFLLSELPAGVAGHPALIFHAAAALIREEAGGRPVIFAVDNADHLDQESASLISQLVVGNKARLVMTVTDFARADAAFMALWRNGLLERIDLLPFTVHETRTFIESELGGLVSREAVDRLWDLAGGNLQITRAAIRALVQRGILTRRGKAWVLLPGSRTLGADLISASTLLRDLSGGQRRVVNLLSLSGPLRWSELRQLAAVEDLDLLQAAGILVVRPEGDTTVSLAQPTLADSVAEAVGPDEAAALRRDLCAVPAARRRLEDDVSRNVGWMLKAGLEVSEDDAVRAASALNDIGNYAEVIDLVQRMHDRIPSLRLAYEGFVAALGEGDLKAAAIHAARLDAAGSALDPVLWTLYKISESRLRRMSAVGNPAEPLQEISARLTVLRGETATEGSPSCSELALLERLLVAATADLASFKGQYRDNLQVLPRYVDMASLASASREDREFQVTVQSLLLEAQATLHQQFAATDLAQSLARNLMQSDVSYPVADQALLRVEIAFLVAGGWSDAARLLAEVSRSSNRWSFRLGSLAQLSEGLVLIAQDRSADAVRILVPVVEQLKVADPHGLLPVAAAALTSCHSQTSDMEQMIARLPLTEPGRGSSWVVRRAARHYQLLSFPGSENRAEAARKFHQRAQDDRDHGASMWALISLSLAVRLGRHEAIEELAQSARTLEGPLATVCATYSAGLLAGSMELLAQAMEDAAAAGNQRFAADIAHSAIRAATRNQDKAGLRLVQRRLRELVPDSASHGTGGGLELLTAREREVAMLASAGTTNRAIAGKLFVSVRTVEGHLYQVYSKLSVSTRAELADIVPAESIS